MRCNLCTRHFYPRSPCGERPRLKLSGFCLCIISIHALLAESDGGAFARLLALSWISIHALLAESDPTSVLTLVQNRNFYPRSPCGERRAGWRLGAAGVNFYPRSPCGERQDGAAADGATDLISIHALLAESDDLHRGEMVLTARISIHALLAESDRATSFAVSVAENFYPRSPCGERPEADGIVDVIGEFLSTLSLRRATPRRC